MLIWSEQFATGIPLIDSQHRMLIERINQLARLLADSAASVAGSDEIVDFLGSFMATHFSYEEGCMAKLRCPAYDRNKQAHAAFTNVYTRFRTRYLNEGPQPELLQELHAASAAWIKNHILRIDLKLRGCGTP
jgi:hemerythrin